MELYKTLKSSVFSPISTEFLDFYWISSILRTFESFFLQLETWRN